MSVVSAKFPFPGWMSPDDPTSVVFHEAPWFTAISTLPSPV
jgi:hypothetical protein